MEKMIENKSLMVVIIPLFIVTDTHLFSVRFLVERLVKDKMKNFTRQNFFKENSMKFTGIFSGSTKVEF